MAEALDQLANAFASARSEQPPETLTRETIRWLAGLPPTLRPSAMPVRFPHMANALSQRWSDRGACCAYFDDLLIDHRGNRQGLPGAVAEELAALKNYFETVVHPTPQTVWDEVAKRQRSR